MQMGPSHFLEIGKYDEFNVCYDITYVTAGLRIAREAATLKNDAALLKRIDSVIDQVPAYGTQPDPDQNGQTVIQPLLVKVSKSARTGMARWSRASSRRGSSTGSPAPN